MSHNLRHRDAVTSTDDLTRIEAIGPRRAERLKAAGIRTYAGLASRSRDEIAAVLPDVSPAKIDAWRDEARELALASSAQEARDVPAAPDTLAGPEAPAGPGESAGDGQRYESVLVRILLNQDGTVRRVTAQHIRTGAEHHWSTLEREALPDFIEAAIAASAQPAKPPTEAPGERARNGQTTPPRPAEAHRAPADEVQRARTASSAVLSVERTPLRAAEPFTLTMAIELAGPVSHADRLAYSAVVVAMPLTGGQKQTVAKSDGVLATTASTISIAAAGLSPGAYRLDAAVSLREPGADRPVDLAGIAEGLLVQVLPG